MYIENYKHQDLLDKKQSSDRMWDRVFDSVIQGNVDLNLIGVAMHMCNVAERRLMEYEHKLGS